MSQATNAGGGDAVGTLDMSTTTSTEQAPPCKTSSSRKRYANGAPKRSVTVPPDPNEPDVADYTKVLNTLAAAVTKSPPKRDKLEKWSEVLVDDMRDLPPEIQGEARHVIDGYIVNLTRACNSAPAHAPAPSTNVASNDQKSVKYNTSSGSIPQTSEQNVQQASGQTSYANLANLSPLSSQGIPTLLDTSPGTAQFLNRIMAPAATFQGYQGQV